MGGLRRVKISNLSNSTFIYLPVTPLITFKESMNTTSLDLFGFGEVDSGTTAKLITWSAESFFPDSSNEYPFDMSYPEKHAPEYYIQLLKIWMKQQHKLKFWYYSEDEPQVGLYDYYCKITGFTYGEKYGNKDVYYTLDFREYKELTLKDSNVILDSTGYSNSGTHIVLDGETLPIIAAKVYGDSSKWVYLMNLNKLSNPLNIKIGQVLLT
ncbi:MAG: LysM peptidoglycan-binding domain-containing protein [Solirubrobacterales bacterium]